MQGIIMIERTQIMDKLYIKHKVRMADMLAAEKEYNLANDPELVALKNANKAKREQKAKQDESEAIRNIKASISPE